MISHRHVDPPSELCQEIFPWVESELAAYSARLETVGAAATDYSLKNFLNLLLELRVILLQDAAVLQSKYPDLHLWKYAPFNSHLFHNFSQASNSILENAEAEARHQLESLPETVSRSMQGILETMSVQRRQEQIELAAQRQRDQEQVSESLRFMEGLMVNTFSSKPKGKKYTQNQPKGKHI